MKKMLLCIIGSFLLAGLPLVATADVYPNVIRGWDISTNPDDYINVWAYQHGVDAELNDACYPEDSINLLNEYCKFKLPYLEKCFAAGVNDTADKYGRHSAWQMYFESSPWQPQQGLWRKFDLTGNHPVPGKSYIDDDYQWGWQEAIIYPTVTWDFWDDMVVGFYSDILMDDGQSAAFSYQAGVNEACLANHIHPPWENNLP